MEEQEDTTNRPPKPPAPVLPPSLAKPQNLRSTDNNSTPKVGIDQNFIDGGSESTASSVSTVISHYFLNLSIFVLLDEYKDFRNDNDLIKNLSHMMNRRKSL